MPTSMRTVQGSRVVLQPSQSMISITASYHCDPKKEKYHEKYQQLNVKDHPNALNDFWQC